MSQQNPKNNIKIILIGESGVGKTNLINVAMDKGFEFNTISSNLSSFLEGNILYNNKDYIYTLWDTAGQEMYRSLNKIFIKGAKIVICVYAIDNKDSFDQLEFWINSAKEILGDDKYLMAILANKSDLFEEQQVSDEEGKEFAKKYNCKFCLTSASEDAKGVKKFFKEIIIDYINLIGPEADNVLNFKLHETEKKLVKAKKKKVC
jgi:small GTP-binding protein